MVEQEIRKTIAMLRADDNLFEVRILREDGKVLSGYFTNVEILISELKKQNTSNCNIYTTLNVINPACYTRSQKDHFEQRPKATTNDNDIIGLEYIFVDLDPKRPSGTSASNEELAEAKKLGNKVYLFMQDLGFENPLAAASGNGVHLLYKIKLKNEPDKVELVKKCLQTLSMMFDTERISVDVKNFNPARICKLYGTAAQKGSNTAERPHRVSHIIGDVTELKATDVKYLEKLCEHLPQTPDKPRQYNNYNPKEFDLEEWLRKYGIRYRTGSYADGTKYMLDECPFDSNHKGKDACIFHSKGGAIGFHCFHNSCAGKTWQDVRLLFEPDAYEKKYQEQGKQMYNSFNRDKPKVESKSIIAKENIPVFYTAMDILKLPNVPESFIKTGIIDVDKRMRGLKKGYVTIVSGLRGSAKSTVLSQIILDAIQVGNNVGCFSGELREKDFMRWMNLQAAGKSHVEPSQFQGYYVVKYANQNLIAEWLGEHFVLYNNKYGNDFKAVAEQFEKVIEEKKLDMLILDNLMAFNIGSLADNKWDAQTEFVWTLQRMAKKHDIHIIFVAHPRKAMGFLRLDDISGTGDLGNAVDNAFIVHRNNQDFKRLSKQMFSWKDDNRAYMGTNVIEIAKDRDGGTQDVFIPLYYEIESKRLKNDQSENKIYGWNNDDGFITCNKDEMPFE